MKYILFLLFFPRPCQDKLLNEWYRLIDRREIAVYMSVESDSLSAPYYKAAADSLLINIKEVEWLMEE